MMIVRFRGDAIPVTVIKAIRRIGDRVEVVISDHRELVYHCVCTKEYEDLVARYYEGLVQFVNLIRS